MILIRRNFFYQVNSKIKVQTVDHKYACLIERLLAFPAGFSEGFLDCRAFSGCVSGGRSFLSGLLAAFIAASFIAAARIGFTK